MTEQELFQAILQAEANDRELTEILKKIRAGTADFQDTQRYSARCAEIEAKILSQNLSPAGTGQNEQNCQQLLENQFEDTIQKESAVQKALDQKQNIHIQPKKPKFPAVRVQKAAHSLEDETVSEDVLRRRAESAVANIMNSFHDDYIRENADFRQKTGLKCRVSRIGASKCCSWCQKISGTFEVGHEPADFWRRHDNCTCQIIYENQKVRQRLSGSGMGWQVNSESQRRQAQRIQYKPTRFTREQAQALESQQLNQYRGLTTPLDKSASLSLNSNQIAKTAEELQKNAEQIDNFLDDYATRKSKWSGNAFRAPKEYLSRATGRKEWDCSITIREDADIKTVIHELLHARSCSHFSKEDFTEHRIMEETSVELYAQEICKKNGILFDESYPLFVGYLREINRIVKLEKTDFDFGRKLLDMDMKMRYNWIKEQSDKADVSPEMRFTLEYLLEQLKEGELS